MGHPPLYIVAALSLYTGSSETITFTTTAPHILIFQTTLNAPYAIHTASIDPQIRNDTQHRASKDLRCDVDEHSCHMWYGCSYIPHRRSFPPQNMVTFLNRLLATPVTLCKGWQSGSNVHNLHSAAKNIDAQCPAVSSYNIILLHSLSPPYYTLLTFINHAPSKPRQRCCCSWA